MPANTEPDIAILLLAAGQSKRFDSAKQLADCHGQALVVRSANALLATGLPVYVVTGAYQQQVSLALPAACQQIHNPDWQQGIGKSIAVGVENLADKYSHILLTLADLVNFDSASAMQLIDSSLAYPHAIIASHYEGIDAVPAIFPSTYFDALTALSGDKGGRKIIQQQADNVHTINMPRAATDIDTQAQYQAWLSSPAID